MLARVCRALVGNIKEHAPCASCVRSLHTDAGLSSGHMELREASKDFALRELLPHSSAWDESKKFPIDTLRLMGDAGYGGCFVGECHGGLSLNRSEAAALFEGMAYGDVPVAAYATIHNMVGRVINTYATEAGKGKYLKSVASMEMLTSYCLTEPGSGSDAASMSTVATPCEGGFELSGSKAFISGGSVSDLYLVMARTATGAKGSAVVTAFLVEGSSAGVSFGKQEVKMGWRCQPTCTVHFDSVRVPAENQVGKEGEGFKIAMSALDGGRINIAACSLGGAQFCFDKTSGVPALVCRVQVLVQPPMTHTSIQHHRLTACSAKSADPLQQLCAEYIRERKQFGKRIDEFQNTQFRMADNATKLVASRTLVQQAAHALDCKDPSGSMLAAMAKRFATDACYEVVDSCLQLHGGYGYIQDYLIEQRLRDLRVHSILEGTNEIMRHVIWNGLRKEAAL